ncbi:MAG: hypothetical protein QOJ97_2927 [Solirubrobacteraceae bacterium]|jgi:signal transduction histidine kinase|nr:hypothetical protein [Solirubrobacteraceae bacterium]
MASTVSAIPWKAIGTRPFVGSGETTSEACSGVVTPPDSLGWTMTEALDALRLRRLVEVGAHLTQELDLEAVLRRVLEVARELTGARYAALGVLDEQKRELERFITLGIDEAGRQRIGELPRGRGVLGLLIEDPRPLRLHDVSDHPRSYGFPPEHPPMRSFLGVPITVRGEPYGNLYLAEKPGGDFGEADEEAVKILAEWAAVAVDNARLYTRAENRRVDLERAVRGLEATVEISRALGGETDLARVLELIVKRSRALVEARALVILLLEGEELVVAATAGELRAGQRGQRVPMEGSVAARVVASKRAERISDVQRGTGGGTAMSTLGLDAHTALVAPLEFRGRVLGVLQAFDRMSGGTEFTREDEVLLASFAASAATAVATAQSVERGRLEQSVQAAEQERRRWARELHDDTLQTLGAIRLILTRRGREADPGQVMDDAADTVQQAIDGLRGIITELRPAALDELGLAPALESLVEQMAATHETDVELSLDLGREVPRLAPELESTAYRIVQEALNNALRHGAPNQVAIEVSESDGELSVVVRDDGKGFDMTAPRSGFGLLGMQERTELVDGVVTVDSRPGGGTAVVATLPARRAPETQARQV